MDAYRGGVLTSAELLATTFPTTRLLESYTRDEVDALIDQGVRALVAWEQAMTELRERLAAGSSAQWQPPQTLTADQARQVRFTPLRLRTGYKMPPVDDVLTMLELTLEEYAEESRVLIDRRI